MPNFKKEVAFFTVVYPGVEPYLGDFFRSIATQTYPHFDLIIGNDGLSSLDLVNYRPDISIIDLEGTPAEVRDAGFQFLRSEGYKYVVFGDSDDFFSPTRVETSLDLLQKYDVVVNDLDLVEADGRLIQPGYLSQRLNQRVKIGNEFIYDKNVFGLSNTAVRTSLLPSNRIPAELLAVDWFVFANILERGARAIFTTSTRTFYRQHGSNIAGLGDWTLESILRGVLVKALHYKAMTTVDLEGYNDIAAKFAKLNLRLLEDEGFKNEYIDFLKSKTKDFPCWWESVLLPEEYII